MARITIPYAVADFVDLRERGYYYVDKTDFIPSLEDYNAPVFSVPGVSARVCLYFSKMVMADDMEGLERNFNDLNCSAVEIMVTHNRDLF